MGQARVKTTCYYCGGSGQESGDSACGVCNGTGKSNGEGRIEFDIPGKRDFGVEFWSRCRNGEVKL